MNIWLSLNKALTLWRDCPAIVDGEKRFTYSQFGKRVFRLCWQLQKLGLKKSDVVAVAAPNCHELMEIYYACGISGIVLAPLNYRLAEKETQAILEDAEAKLVFVHEHFGSSFENFLEKLPHLEHVVRLRPESQTNGYIKENSQLKVHEYESLLADGKEEMPDLPHLGADELAHLYYTSGTTGKPKGVMLSQGNVSFNALAVIAELGFKDTDTWLHAAPMFHLADAWSTFAITWTGGTHVILPYFRASQALELLAKEKVTATVLVPTMLNAMLLDPCRNDYGYGSLRYIITGGSPIAPEKVRQVNTIFGCKYLQLYGMTETSPFLTISEPLGRHCDLSEDAQLELRARTGRPYLGAEVKVVDAEGKEVAWNDKEVGEIIARGPTVTKGYWRQPEITAQTIKDNWIHTGDLAVVDKDGFINIVDRQKDMIITGGENVYSTEVEYALYEHPAVAECAVFGIPDKSWGEAVKAVVVLKDGEKASAAELIDFIRSKLAHYKSPKSIDFLPELPKTGSGKIYKKGLRDPHWDNQLKQVH